MYKLRENVPGSDTNALNEIINSHFVRNFKTNIRFVHKNIKEKALMRERRVNDREKAEKSKSGKKFDVEKSEQKVKETCQNQNPYA